MVTTELAVDVYEGLVNKVSNFRESSFYLQHEGMATYAGGFEAIVGFLVDRPAMLVMDTLNPAGILNLLDKEWYEAEHADKNETESELYAEIGDTYFFAMLAGMLHWDNLTEDQREFVERSMKWSEETASLHNMSIVDSVIYVASVKDPINYRKELYQLIDGETSGAANSRSIQIGVLHRLIRKELNNGWKEAGNLLQTLAKYCWDSGNEEDVIAIQIEALFDLANIDILSHIEV